MAITLGSSVAARTVRLEMYSSGSGNTIIKTFKLNGSMNDTDVIALLTALNALTNAGLKVGTVDGRLIAGWTGPVNALQNLVGTAMVLAFKRANPVNSAKQITKTFVVPAYKDALNVSGSPDVTDTNLAALITALQDNLAFLGSDGTYYHGSFEYTAAKSGFGTFDMLEIE